MRARLLVPVSFAALLALAACAGSRPMPAPAPGPTSSGTSKLGPIEVIPNDEISDADGDGVLDADDACPNDPEDRDSFEDADGCPEADNDKDTILDANDKCPNEPETFNGKDDDDGCPDTTKLVIISCPPTPIIQYVHFKVGSAAVPAEAKALLDMVVQTLKSNPQVLVVGLEGHADDPGGVAANVALSQKRADAVRKELEARGIDASRLRSKGMGSYCPVDGGASPAAKEHNRGVRFWVLETTSGIAAEPAGCAEATKHGLVLTP